MSQFLLEVSGLQKTFRGHGREVTALDNVSLGLKRGETLAIAGASGSGKSTLARAIVRLVEPDAGRVAFDGLDLLALRGAALRRQRARLQMVFQDPLSSINPRATVARAIADPLEIHGIVARDQVRRRVDELLGRVGLPVALASRYVHELSGGQRQRVAIARAVATSPALLILDEPASALDVSVRGQILNLLLDIQAATGMAYLFISHDLGVVRAMADRIAIMESGRIVETGATDTILREPASAAAKALIAAVPQLKGREQKVTA